MEAEKAPTEQAPSSGAEEEGEGKGHAEKEEAAEKEKAQEPEEATGKSNPPEERWKAAQKQAEEYGTRLKYLAAEFDNYKKHVEKQKREWMDLGEAKLMNDLLQTVDELEKAVETLKREEKNAESLHGLLMTEKNLHRILRAHGLKEIGTQGKFDANMQEAVGFEEVAAEEKAGAVVKVERKGYWFKDKVLRHARVVVGKYVRQEKQETRATEKKEEEAKSK